MALKALLLKKELDGKRTALAKADRTAEFEKRTAELEQAVTEVTEDTTPEEREALTQSVEELEAEKAENEAAITKLREEIAELESELAEIEKEQEVPAQPEERTKDMSEIITRDSKEYVEAYADYIKGNKSAKEMRALLTENVEDGMVAVPSIVYDTVKTAWEKNDIMRLVRKTYLRGNVKVGFEISGSEAVYHNEGEAAISPEELVLGIVTLVPASIKKVIQVSDEALDMGGEEFLRYLYEELTYRIAKAAADDLLDGIAGAPTPATLPINPNEPVQGVVEVSAIDVGTIAQAIANLSDEAANPVVVMNKLTWGSFKAAQYANGFNADPFEGLTVIFNNHLPSFDDADSTDTFAIVGDFGAGALANFPNGQDIEIKVDRLTLKKQDLVEILGRMYVGAAPVAPYAFCRLNKVSE